MTAERAFLRRLGAGCLLPVAAYAVAQGDIVRLRGLIGTDDGRIFQDEISGFAADSREPRHSARGDPSSRPAAAGDRRKASYRLSAPDLATRAF